MYRVTRTKTLPKTFRTTKFQTYEEARSAVRVWIRKNVVHYTPFFCYRSNPSITEFGFSIEKV